MTPAKRCLGILLALVLLLGCSACAAASQPAPQATLRPADTPSPASAEAPDSAGRDVVILTTTDMHGKCWETNLLTGSGETHNMLRVSTVVRQIRETYGGWSLVNVGTEDEQGLEYYGGCFTTYQAGNSEAFTFNFYELE